MPTTQPSIDFTGIASVIGQLATLIVAVTALWQVARNTRKVEEVKTDSAAARSEAQTASKLADVANMRASNNAQALNGVQQQLTQVALQTPPAKSPVDPVSYPGGTGGSG